MTIYYFALASQDFLLEEEPVEEILRERTNYYKSLDKPIDFWLIKDQSFLQKPEFIHIKQQLIKPSAIIISSNKKFIDWLKLRLGFVITGQLNSKIQDIENLLIN